MSYGKGGSVSATGGVAADAGVSVHKKAGPEIPYLKIMAVIIVLVLLFLAWLGITGY
jgi:hypothetical protein